MRGHLYFKAELPNSALSRAVPIPRNSSFKPWLAFSIDLQISFIYDQLFFLVLPWLWKRPFLPDCRWNFSEFQTALEGGTLERFSRAEASKPENLSLPNALSPSGGQEVTQHGMNPSKSSDEK